MLLKVLSTKCNSSPFKYDISVKFLTVKINTTNFLNIIRFHENVLFLSEAKSEKIPLQI